MLARYIELQNWDAIKKRIEFAPLSTTLLVFQDSPAPINSLNYYF